MTADDFYGWTAGTKRDGQDLLATIAREHGIPEADLMLMRASDGDGWSVWLR